MPAIGVGGIPNVGSFVTRNRQPAHPAAEADMLNRVINDIRGIPEGKRMVSYIYHFHGTGGVVVVNSVQLAVGEDVLRAPCPLREPFVELIGNVIPIQWRPHRKIAFVNSYDFRRGGKHYRCVAVKIAQGRIGSIAGFGKTG